MVDERNSAAERLGRGLLIRAKAAPILPGAPDRGHTSPAATSSSSGARGVHLHLKRLHHAHDSWVGQWAVRGRPCSEGIGGCVAAWFAVTAWQRCGRNEWAQRTAGASPRHKPMRECSDCAAAGRCVRARRRNEQRSACIGTALPSARCPRGRGVVCSDESAARKIPAAPMTRRAVAGPRALGEVCNLHARASGPASLEHHVHSAAPRGRASARHRRAPAAASVQAHGGGLARRGRAQLRLRRLRRRRPARPRQAARQVRGKGPSAC